ncbi:hypothetical protein CTEN210_12295 [Chaetoceros tenuissimus]|uniref:Uncharacterized protein n=1 Tax=Chaetoceros tenuissimus TaxID=426638 RepID=A0AAD3HAC2_9STRA|nr:hypothetical protein CTEN210_12295 [Chaetoceros tenuissimus]
MSTDAENPQGQETAFDDEKGGADNESSSKGFLVYYNTLMRLVMSAFLIAAGAFTIPSVIVPTYKEAFDFQYCAVCFIIGTGIFFTCTLIDFMGAVGNGTIAMLNSSLYVLGSLALVIGSIFFYPDVNTTGEPVGQYLYIAGTLTVCSGLFGNVIPFPFIVALFSALVGAINFNYGANFLLPLYTNVAGWDVAVEKGGRFFIVGGVCFAIHSFAIVKAYLM